MLGDDERLFLRVVESGSLKSAAAAIRMDPSTVSRRIAALEDRLGVRLLQRSTRGSRPTDVGTRYFEGLRAAAAELEALEADITDTRDAPTGLLRITAPSEFGARFVVPVLDHLCQDAPELDVELDLGTAFFDLAERHIDVAVRIGRLPDSALRARRLGSVPRVIVGSRDYLDTHGRPEAPGDLADHEFALYRRRSPKPVVELIASNGRVESCEMPCRLTVNHIPSIVDIVTRGRALTYGPLWAFQDAIESGALEAVLPQWSLEAYPLHALYRPSPYVPAKIRAFIDRMVAHVKASSGLGP